MEDRSIESALAERDRLKARLAEIEVIILGMSRTEAFEGGGTVKWFNDGKGFGFITHATSGEDVFVHHTAIQSCGYRSLEQGQRVVFGVRRGPRGLHAENVRVVEG